MKKKRKEIINPLQLCQKERKDKERKKKKNNSKLLKNEWFKWRNIGRKKNKKSEKYENETENKSKKEGNKRNP